MSAKLAVLAALVAAVTLTSVAAAGPEAAKQRVAITSNGVLNATAFGKFVFTPLQAGALKRDTGTETSHWSERVVMRDGQRVTVQNYVTTRNGKRGSFVVRSRMEYVDAGNGYLAGTNTWKFVRGTGQYAQITGGGRGWRCGRQRALERSLRRLSHPSVARCTRRSVARSRAAPSQAPRLRMPPAVARLKRT